MARLSTLTVSSCYVSLFQSIAKWLGDDGFDSQQYNFLCNLIFSTSLSAQYALHPDCLNPLCFFDGYALTYEFVQNELIFPNSFIYNLNSLHEYFILLGVVSHLGRPVHSSAFGKMHRKRNFDFFGRNLFSAQSDEYVTYRQQLRLSNKLFVEAGHRSYISSKLLDYYEIYYNLIDLEAV